MSTSRSATALLAAALLLPALPALALVDLPPNGTDGQVRVAASGKPSPCCIAAAPLLPFGLPGLAEAELLARWTAAPRSGVLAERTRWRAVRIAGRSQPGTAPASSRSRKGK
jgi:hypothetical protein